MRCRLFLFAIVIFGLPSTNIANSEENPITMSLTLKAEPSENVTSTSLSRPFEESEIGQHVYPVTVKVVVTKGDKEPSSLSMVWEDGTSSQISLLLVAAFANKNVEVIFFKEPKDEQASSKCSPSATSNLRLIFQMYFFVERPLLWKKRRANGPLPIGVR